MNYRFHRKLSSWHRGSAGNIDFRRKKNISNQFFFYIFIVLVMIGSLIIVLRLFHLCIVKGNYYSLLSEENRVREIVIEPARGKIIDRKGFVVAENKPADKSVRSDRFFSQRIYQAGEAMAHLIGYRQLADDEDLTQDNCMNKLSIGDKVGKKGVEKLFQCKLRGKPGKELIEVDASGKYLRTITMMPPIDGDTIQLAVDLQLQKLAYELIKGKRGAVVGIKPQTGEVLVLTASPAYDPQKFEDKDSSTISQYFTVKDKPLFNRATDAAYPPGSVFKPFVALSALEEKKIDSTTLIEDTGSIKAGPLTFGNWYFLQYGKTEGMVNVVKALQRSNDIFFYKTGEIMGPEMIRTWADRFGFGEKTNIGLEEVAGLIPSPFWKMETLKEKWYLGDTYNLSIGQGYLLVTPLQMAVATAAIANDGVLCMPQLLKTAKNNQCKKLSVSQKNIFLVKEGMRAACTTGGTGWPLFDFAVNTDAKSAVSTASASLTKLQTACKTGTAESHAVSGIPHAWFTIYAPSENPEIVLTVLLEEAGQGSDMAAPIARDILKAYFERKE